MHTHSHTHTVGLMGSLDVAQGIHTGQDFTCGHKERAGTQSGIKQSTMLMFFICSSSCCPSLTLEQLQAGTASCADVADLVFCVPLGAAGGSVAPTWTDADIQHTCMIKEVYHKNLKKDSI